MVTLTVQTFLIKMLKEKIFDEQLGDGYSWDVKKERDIIDPINGKVYKYLSAKDRWDRNDFDQTQNLLDWIWTNNWCHCHWILCLW